MPLGILPGLAPPHAVAVRQDDKNFVYVRYDCATWAGLTGALEERTMNVRRATARRRDHKLKMAALAKYMKDSPERTVAEACDLLRKEAQAA